MTEHESASGAMQAGQAAGTPGGPVPRTDAADPGVEPIDRLGSAGGVSDVAEGTLHVPGGREDDATAGPGGATTAAGPLGDAARRDPPPEQVPGTDDAGARGRDRDNGGWGDRGIGGGRAGGTGG